MKTRHRVIVKKRFLLSAAVMLMFLYVGNVTAQKTHTVFYEGSENELDVYRIYGIKPGKTLLLIGGIQGDEPGGFLAADLYADFSLEKGNLIVVPRANFPSILQCKRKVNEDMNRKFADDHVVNYEAKVVQVLKQLIMESDCLLNLHEGSGIYSETWESPLKNPSKFGQSIIADTNVFEDREAGIRIDLKAMAEKVIEEINLHIENPEHWFHFNNHRTSQKDSIHKEQRKSATYYALYSCGIPAFGIESAKDLPLEKKVRQHIYAINGFMELFDIIPETPGVDLKKPKLKYMVVSVNGSVPVVVENMQHLEINPDDTVEVIDIIANYQRGLSIDIVGVGSRLNDLKKKIVVSEGTRIVAKKDFYPCGSIFLDVKPHGGSLPGLVLSGPDKPSSEIRYRVRIDGKARIADTNDHIELTKTSTFEIIDIITKGIDPSVFVVNFKGFVGNRANNTGEDRGYVIDIGRNVLMKRYSIEKKGSHYYIVTTLDDKEVSRLYIDIIL